MRPHRNGSGRDLLGCKQQATGLPPPIAKTHFILFASMVERPHRNPKPTIREGHSRRFPELSKPQEAAGRSDNKKPGRGAAGRKVSLGDWQSFRWHRVASLRPAVALASRSKRKPRRLGKAPGLRSWRDGFLLLTTSAIREAMGSTSALSTL